MVAGLALTAAPVALAGADNAWAQIRMLFAAMDESVVVKMLWGGGEGCGTFGAVQQLPTERPHVAIL